jgi:hypothetical protein
MAEPSPPDLRDSTGRAIRIIVGLAIGVAAGVVAYFLANALIAPEPDAMYVSRRQMGRDTFVAWVSLLTGVVSLFVALVVQNRIATNKWERERLPQARVR